MKLYKLITVSGVLLLLVIGNICLSFSRLRWFEEKKRELSEPQNWRASGTSNVVIMVTNVGDWTFTWTNDVDVPDVAYSTLNPATNACCKRWSKLVPVIDAALFTAHIHGQEQHNDLPFRFCPWCGTSKKKITTHTISDAIPNLVLEQRLAEQVVRTDIISPNGSYAIGNRRGLVIRISTNDLGWFIESKLPIACSQTNGAWPYIIRLLDAFP